MTKQEIEVIEDGDDFHVETAVTLFGTNDPTEVIARATAAADALADVLENKGLFTNINGRKHVRVEGWTLLGTMLGVFPVVVWTRQLENGWEARVEARTRDGQVVGAAEAECLRDENQWKNRDDYALRSMAQTRATSKALRHPLGFVVSLAGYAETPAEEMPSTSGGRGSQGPPLVADRASAATRADLERELTLNAYAPDVWSEVQVKRTATAQFGHQIDDFTDLTEFEAKLITGAARDWREAHPPPDLNKDVFDRSKMPEGGRWSETDGRWYGP